MKKNHKKIRGLAAIIFMLGLLAGSAMLAKVANAATRPVNPSALTATATKTSIELKWVDNSTNETSFQIERALGGVNFSVIATLPANTTSYSDKNLDFGVYFYRIRAINSAGASGYSEIASAYSPVPDPRPATPSNLTASVGPGFIRLIWNDNSTNETFFQIEKVEIGPSQYGVISVPQNSWTYLDTKISAGKTYQYRVRALNNKGGSGYSNTVTVVAQSAPPVPPPPAR